MSSGRSASDSFPVLPGFEVLRQIGKGGMGEVYEAVRLGAGGFRKSVALKTLSPGAHPEPKALQRFLQECRVTARFEHPNIVRVHDLLTVGERHFLVMELLSGVDASALRRVFREGAPPWVVLSVAAQALEGLAYAHAMRDEEGQPLGLVHRDLTLRNLFLCDGGTVKILDFGLARVRDAAALGLTLAGTVPGTPGFMSPEQANGLPLDARSDLFQLGACLYTLLSGHTPYGGGSPEARFVRAMRAEVLRPLRELSPDLPGAVVALVEQAMATEPARRFADARQMLQAVRAALRGLEDTGGPDGLAALVATVRDSDATEVARVTPSPAPPPPSEHSTAALGPGPASLERSTEPVNAPGSFRYRVLRLVGRGGMGAVYEAEDLELGERVALKALRPELAADAAAVERFKREILLAHKVTHPNVCRIFDIGFYPGPLVPGEPAPGGRTVFLSMELIEGETLAALLRRKGRLSTAEALPLAVQMANGLAAAHRAGVVHGDFKSENVVIEPPRPGHPEGRAVVTDFGLARATGNAVDESGARFPMGTPAYLAPEQVEGGPASAAADLYALGVVLYELVTGELPFQGQTPQELAHRRLREPPPRPAAKVPGLDPAWDAAILRCLERDPARRFPDATQVVRGLGERSVAPERPSRRRRGRIAAAVALAAVLLASAAVLGVRAQRARTAAAPAARRAVAVLGFRNLSGSAEAAWLSTALAEMLDTELGADGALRTVPGANVARAKAELGLAGADELSPEQLARAGRDLGADLLLSGSYLALGERGGGKLRLDLALHDARGEPLAKVSVSGAEADLLDLVSRAGASVRERVGLSRLSGARAGDVASALPARPDAARLYAEGLDLMRGWRYAAARERLEQAAAADPSHAGVQVALTNLYSALGAKQKALQAARSARELATGLSEEERLGLEGAAHAAAEDWPRAVEDYRARWALAPDNVEYGLTLGAAQISAGAAPRDLVATLDALRALPSRQAEDPRVDVFEAKVAQRASDFERERRAAVRAAERAERVGARVLVGQARALEGWALSLLGDTTGALAAFEDSRRICDAAGHRECVAAALDGSGTLRMDLGDLQEARARLEAALALRRELGMEGNQWSTLNNLALVLTNQGDFAQARRAHEEALELSRRLGHTQAYAYALANLAPLRQEDGRWADAEKDCNEAMRFFRERKEERGLAACLLALGEGLLARGKLAEAGARFNEGLELLRGAGVKDMVDELLAQQARVSALRGDAAAARRAYSEALEEANALGERGNAARIRLGLAELALAEGGAGTAEGLAREAVELFAAQKAAPMELYARDVLAVALAEGGKGAEAQAAIDAARAVASKLQSRRRVAAHRIAQARVLGALGRAEQGARALAAALPELASLEDVLLEDEARLALGQLELAAGNKAGGRQRLAALAKDARAQGLELFARRASALAREGHAR